MLWQIEIATGRVLGTASADLGWDGYLFVEGIDAPTNSVYWDGEAIVLIPDGQYWDAAARSLQPIPLPPPAPPVTPQPDWAGFRVSLYQSAAWKRIAQVDPVTTAQIVALVWQLQGDMRLILEVKLLWDALAAVALPTPAEIAEIEAIVLRLGMGLAIDSEDGTLILPEGGV